MPCPKCGFAVSATDSFCLECGTALARIPAPFQRVEQEASRLRTELTAGRIDADRYQAALRELMLQHEGRWWMVGADSGQWYVREGDKWVTSAPPGLPEAPTTTPAPAMPPAPPPPAPSPRQAGPPAPAPISAAVRVVTASRLLPGARADALVISPDGAYVVSTGDGYSIKVWDLASARLLHEVRDSGRAADSKAPNAVAVSPGSRYFATAHEGGAIHVWEIATARKLLTWKAHPESCRFLGFSADGRKLISAGPDAIATWEIENARELYRAKVPAALGRVAMSGDGAKLLVHFGDDWEPDFRIFDAATGRELAQMELRFDQAAPIDALSAMALSTDGKLALLGAINELYLVDTDSGRPVRKIASHGMVECAALTADGRRILVGTSAQAPNDEELEKADSPEWDAIFKRLLSAPLANKVHVWDAASGSELVRFDGHPEAVKALAVSVDGKRVVSSGGDGFARIWDLGI